MISAIVPLFNAAQWIGAALDSVALQNVNLQSANSQSANSRLANLEIVVVNDGSTDHSADVVRAWHEIHRQIPLRLIEQANGGAAHARNVGLKIARGEFVAFLDADDYWPTDALAAHAREIEAAHADIAIGLSQIVSANGEPFGDPFRLPGMPTSLVKRAAFEQIGGFDPQLRGSEDVDWFLRARDAGLKFVEHGALVHFYRRHGANTTEGKSLADLDFHRALKRSLDRRRAAGRVEISCEIPKPQTGDAVTISGNSR